MTGFLTAPLLINDYSRHTSTFTFFVTIYHNGLILPNKNDFKQDSVASYG